VARSADQGARLAAWHQALERQWHQLGFGAVNVATVGEQHGFEVQVRLGELDPDAIRVELYADGLGGGPPVRQELKRVGRIEDSDSYGYRGAVSAARPAADYTARLVPFQSGVAVPLEDAHILWQR
jgi:starch phosphorylase